MQRNVEAKDKPVEIPLSDVTLDGDLVVPVDARGIVLFAHGSGSSRKSPRNRFVAAALHEAQIGTLLFDLLTPAEETLDRVTAELRFDVPLLARRLSAATDWLWEQPAQNEVELDDLRLGYFGASTGAAAALIAAATREDVAAVVSRGGRPDLAAEALPLVTAPTLLIVGGDDDVVIGMNREAQRQMRCETRLEIIPGASHLFEEPGTLEEVARLARMWFEGHLGRQSSAQPLSAA
jgi:pimeloyl-ACP methyl ester carboxylesterase